MKRKHGFTLTELIIVLAILAILAAILVPLMVSYIKESQKATCHYNMKTFQRAFVYEAGLEQADVKDLEAALRKAAENLKGIEVLSASSVKLPCGGTGVILYSADRTSILQMSCSIHDDADGYDYTSPGNVYGIVRAGYGIQALLDNKATRKQIETYITSKITNKAQTLDSGGKNWAPEINAELERLGYGSLDYSWQIRYYISNKEPTKGHKVYEVYWTDTDINNGTVKPGDVVAYRSTKIDLTTNETLYENTGTSVVIAKAADNKTFNVLNAEKNGITVDTGFGDSFLTNP